MAHLNQNQLLTWLKASGAIDGEFKGGAKTNTHLKKDVTLLLDSGQIVTLLGGAGIGFPGDWGMIVVNPIQFTGGREEIWGVHIPQIEAIRVGPLQRHIPPPVEVPEPPTPEPSIAPLPSPIGAPGVDPGPGPEVPPPGAKPGT